jgi:hypothetical protein
MTMLTTPESIALFRLATLRTALKLELLGMKHSSGKSAYSTLKGMGYKGTRAEVLEAVAADVQAGLYGQPEEGTVISE